MNTKTNVASGGMTYQTFTTDTYKEWNKPTIVDVIDTGNSIEMVYVQTKNSIWGGCLKEKRVFKIVYSCVDGKWHKSEPIFGKIIPAQEEYYEFDK